MPFTLFTSRLGRTSLFMAVVLTLMLAALPTGVMAAPAAGYGHHDGYSCNDCYVVQAGDTLSEIAKSYHVSQWELAKYNHISDPSKIYVGQTLYIPNNHCGDCGGYEKPGDDYGCDGCGDSGHDGHNHDGYHQADYGHDCGGDCGDYHNSDYSHDDCGGGCGGHGGDYYVVQPGDSLSQIAKWNGVSVWYLCEKNGISDPNTIYVGQVIWL
jgi:LysM repeat protein